MNDHRKYDATYPNFFLFKFVFLALISNERAMYFVIVLYLLREDTDSSSQEHDTWQPQLLYLFIIYRFIRNHCVKISTKKQNHKM